MFQTAAMLFENKPCSYEGETLTNKGKNVRWVRKITLLPVRETKKNVTIWTHAKTLIRVENTVYEGDAIISPAHVRIFATSMESTRLSAEEWLNLIVKRWCVETSHQTLDVTFVEDDRPWIMIDAQGALVIQILRRIVMTILCLYRSVTLRNDDRRTMPFKKWLDWIRDMLCWPNEAEFFATASVRGAQSLHLKWAPPGALGPDK